MGRDQHGPKSTWAEVDGPRSTWAEIDEYHKDHSTKICELCLTCMLVAVRSSASEFVRKFPLKL